MHLFIENAIECGNLYFKIRTMRLEVDLNYNRIVMIDTHSQFLQKLAKLVEALNLVQIMALTDVESASKTGYLDLIADNPKTLLILDMDSLDANAVDVLKKSISNIVDGEIEILGLFDKWSESMKKLTDLLALPHVAPKSEFTDLLLQRMNVKAS